MPRHLSLGSSVLFEEHNAFDDGLSSITDANRTVGLLGVIVIGFFWVAGGIYGNEELIGSGASGLILCGLVGGGLLFALPFALMCAELATTYPENGGVIVPVRYALGMTSANHMAYLNWIVNALDASIYPLLAAEYLKSGIPDVLMDNVPYAERLCISFPIILIVTVFNLFGLNWVVRFSNVIFVFALTPCLIYIFWGIINGDVKWNAFKDFSGDNNMSVGVSWIIWLYSGFVSLGILAGEVQNPQKTFLGAVIVLVPLTISLNIIPVLVSLGIDPDTSNYDVGYFEDLAAKECGEWLRYGFVIGSTAAYVGLYNSQIVSAQEAFAFLIEANLKQQVSQLNFTCWKYLLPIFIDKPQDFNNNKKNDSNKNNNNNNNNNTDNNDKNKRKIMNHSRPSQRIKDRDLDNTNGDDDNESNNHLDTIHLHNSRAGERSTMSGNSGNSGPSGQSSNIDVLTSAERDKALAEQATITESQPRTIRARRFYVVVNFFLICIFSWVPYAVIVQAEMLVNNIPLFLLCYSFIHLRFFDENRERPFQVPGGIIGACLIVFVPVIVLILYTIVTVQDKSDRFLKLLLFFVIVMVGFLFHLIWITVSWIQNGASLSMPKMFRKKDTTNNSELISESSDVMGYMTFGMSDGNDDNRNNHNKYSQNSDNYSAGRGGGSGGIGRKSTPEAFRPTHNDYRYFRPYINENDDIASSNMASHMYDNVSGLHVHNLATLDDSDDGQSELVSDLYGSRGM